ncbi:ketosynthase chain-length factor [Streptomyces sp. NRRL F-5126]|uniref:ketosynthase chain-length factor n=1 Tax=Streptomyces sp. NRRL F-5126 TaxID=1463857 RepID=UPI00068D1612|nr:ketosynthase chain-length factor [Streptomyces sp. NRRL F-5126]
MTSATAPRTAPGDRRAETAAPVFTGIGVAAPNGLGTRDWWRATLAGESGIRPVSRFDASGYPATLAGEVPGFDPQARIPNRLLPQTDHMTRLALTAADEALADSGADVGQAPDLTAGVATAASAGGFEFGQRELQALWSKGGQYVSAYQSFAWFYAVNAGQISIKHGLGGPSGVLVTEQAGGLDAVAQARRHLRKGSRLIVTGGVDGAVCPWGWTAQLTGGRMTTVSDPAAAYLPFDAAASGHVPGEGGAILVLEAEAAARERGARTYGAFAGYAATFDPPPGSGGEPGLRRAIELALADAGTAPEQVDAVFADAAGVLSLDRAESAAIRAVFGERAVPVTAPKTMTGRLQAGAGSLDLAAALLSIRDGVLPPTVGVRPDPGHGLDLVTSARECRVRTALVLARGQGGFNAATVVTAAGS